MTTKEQKTSLTIGQRATKDASEYFQLFLKLQTDFGTEKAQTLAEHDLLVRKLIAEFALEDLKSTIEEWKQKQTKTEVSQ